MIPNRIGSYRYNIKQAHCNWLTQLPQNAVLIVELDAELRNGDDHLRLMFLMSKAAHPFSSSNPDAWKQKAAQVRKAGGIPYLVSFQKWSLPVMFTSRIDKRTIYSDETP